MVSTEVYAILISGLGITASILYYSMNLRNANKTQRLQLETRQIQLLKDFTQGRVQDGSKVWQDVMGLEWDNYSDFRSKYSHENDLEIADNIQRIWQMAHLTGMLIRDGLIDVGTYVDYMGDADSVIWAKFKDVILEHRRVFNNPFYMRGVEILAEEVDKYRIQQGLGPKIPEDISVNDWRKNAYSIRKTE